MSPAAPRVRFHHISKSYAGVRALDDVSFDVMQGSIHALVGENGAGKSTLMKVLSGDVAADSGWIELDGQRVASGDPRAAQAAGVAIVHQELSLVPDLTVAENIYLGRWPRRRWGAIDFARLQTDAATVCRQLDAAIDVRGPVARLGVAQRQMVEIAKALSLRARVLILDEPSAVLTPHELIALFQVVRRLAADGVSVLYISHRLEEVFELADTITVLRDGRHVSTVPAAQTNRARVVAECVGREMGEEFPVRGGTIGAPVLRVEELSCVGRFSEVSFDVHAGEIFGLAGLVGSGRTSVAQAIFGAVRGVRGRVTIGGRIGPFSGPRSAQRAGIAYVPEDRRRDGLMLARAVRENITLAHPSLISTCGLIRGRVERAAAHNAVGRTRIKSAGIESAAATLSGGNQQKVLLARWLMGRYPLVILDEPTRGVDVGAKAELHRLIAELAAGGTAVLMVSSDLPEVIGLSDRIGVMRCGRVAGILDNRGRNASPEAVMRLAVGEEAA